MQWKRNHNRAKRLKIENQTILRAKRKRRESCRSSEKPVVADRSDKIAYLEHVYTVYINSGNTVRRTIVARSVHFPCGWRGLYTSASRIVKRKKCELGRVNVQRIKETRERNARQLKSGECHSRSIDHTTHRRESTSCGNIRVARKCVFAGSHLAHCISNDIFCGKHTACNRLIGNIERGCKRNSDASRQSLPHEIITDKALTAARRNCDDTRKW